MQNWKKLGLIYSTQTYNAVPVAHFVGAHTLRIYISTRSDQNYSLPFLLDYDLKHHQVLQEKQLNIPLGKLGTFDEHGVMPTSILKREGKLYLYYIGWSLAKSVPFRNAIGLAISENEGLDFTKYSAGPILDRGPYDQCFVASNCIYPEAHFYRMYYLSCSEWKQTNTQLTHSYNIKYAESTDGIHWQREGITMIDFKYHNEYAISCPRVIKEDNKYKMWYSYRGGFKGNTYRIGYAESLDAKQWQRKDEEVGLDVSEQGWDSEMICYPFIFKYNDHYHMLYNGNGYGKTGVGLAKLA